MEWDAIVPLLPRKVRGIKRVDDRRILNGILWRLRTGRAWAAVPQCYGAPGTCQARFIRWRDAGIWARIVEAIVDAYAGEVELIEASEAFVPPRYGHRSVPSGDPVAWRRRSRPAGKVNTPAAFPDRRHAGTPIATHGP
jgi:transposase